MPIYQQLKEPRILWVLFSGLFVNRFGDFVSLVLVLYLISEALPWSRPELPQRWKERCAGLLIR